MVASRFTFGWGLAQITTVGIRPLTNGWAGRIDSDCNIKNNGNVLSDRAEYAVGVPEAMLMVGLGGISNRPAELL